MYERIQSYANIDEVVIPDKRNVEGRRYGFVDFIDVEDASFLASKLDNLFISGQKFFVTIPRFQRRQHLNLEYGNK